MNQRAIQLYQQAAAFAYQTAGADAGRGTIVESLTAGKFVELIIQDVANVLHDNELWNRHISHVLNEHFGVEE